jgi:chitinase
MQIDVDWMNLMSYNFHGPNHSQANTVTNFNAPLFTSKQDPTPQINIDTAVRAMLNLGLNPRKLVIGIPAYAHAYADVNSDKGGLYQGYSGPGPGTYQPGSGILTYKDVMDNYLPICGSAAWDDFTQSSFVYCAKTRVWISPNMAGDVFAKAAYVMKNQLGGLMLWELGADKTDEFRLAEYMSTSLHHTVA